MKNSIKKKEEEKLEGIAKKLNVKAKNADIPSIKELHEQKSFYNPLYYYPNKLFSHDPNKYYFYIAIGSRGKGKTVSAWRWVLKRFIKHGEMFIWLRLTDAPIKKMARNSSNTIVPSFLLKQLGIESVFMRGSTIFMNKKQYGVVKTFTIGIMDSISTYHTTKGNTMEDFTNVVFDEINRETNERNTFDVTRAFINQIESIARMRKIRVLMLGNTINDTSDILSIFNFQPTEFGLYKLTRRKCIIEYLEDSEEFIEQRKNSLAGVLLGDNEDVGVSFVNKTGTSLKNIRKYDHRFRQRFIFHIDTYRSFGVYSMEDKDGLFIGDLRGDTYPQYKISPFLNSGGIYNEDIYKQFYELVSVNMLTFETAMIRDRFIKALKNNRTIVS